MLLNVVYVIVGLAGLYFGGNWLVQGASRLAASLGISPLIIGLTVVAFGTSTPELLVSLNAAASGSSGISIGNVIGSNIANIGLILAVSGLVITIPIHIGLIKREIPFVIGISVLTFLLAMDGEIGQLDGSVLLVVLIGFTGLLINAARRERLKPAEERELQEEEGITGKINRPFEVVRSVAGLVVLLIGANLTVEGAVAIARELQISDFIIGITVVAIGTSLPELASSLAAALKRHDEILFGNVIGSNIFNLLGILGITTLIRPIPVDPALLRFELPVMIGFALVLIIFGLRGRLPRWGSALLLIGYVAFMGLTLQPR